MSKRKLLPFVPPTPEPGTPIWFPEIVPVKPRFRFYPARARDIDEPVETWIAGEVTDHDILLVPNLTRTQLVGIWYYRGVRKVVPWLFDIDATLELIRRRTERYNPNIWIAVEPRWNTEQYEK